MAYVAHKRNYIDMMSMRVKMEWDNKESLKSYKQDLEKLKSRLGYFNRTAGFLGLAITHTFLIYSKKTVLSSMEKKAWNHILQCIGVSLLSGYLVGFSYGNSIINFRKVRKLENAIENRLTELK